MIRLSFIEAVPVAMVADIARSCLPALFPGSRFARQRFARSCYDKLKIIMKNVLAKPKPDGKRLDATLIRRAVNTRHRHCD
jgi:hypothetical protein